MRQRILQFDKAIRTFMNKELDNLTSSERAEKLITISNEFVDEKLLDLTAICLGGIAEIEELEVEKSIRLALKLADLYFRTNKLIDAERLLLELQKKCEVSESARSYLVNVTIAKLYFIIGDLELAKTYIEKSILQALQQKENRAALECILQYIDIAIEMGDVNDAFDILDRAGRLLNFVGDLDMVLNYRIATAKVQIEGGVYQPAESTSLSLIKSSENLKDRKLFLQGVSLLVRTLLNKGEFEQAYWRIKKARESKYLKDAHFFSSEIEYLYWLCIWHLGEFPVAILEFIRIYMKFKDTLNRFASRRLLSTIIESLIFVGEKEEAKSYLEQLEDYGDTSSYFRMQYYFLFGLYNFHHQDEETSFIYINNADEIARKDSNSLFQHKIKLTLAEILIKRSEDNHALDILNDIKKEVITTNNHFNIGKLHYLLASIFHIKNDGENARNAIDEALKCKHPELRVHILHKACLIHKGFGDQEKADEYIEELDKVLHKQINSFYDEVGQERFVNTHGRKEMLNLLLRSESTPVGSEKIISIEKFDDLKSIDFSDQNTCISTLDGEKMFGISRITIFRWIKSGKLKAILTETGRYKIRLADFKEYILSQIKQKNCPLPTLSKYLKLEEKRYIKTLLEAKKSKKEIASILEISEQLLSEKIEEYNL